ncbi:MAG: glycosyltransferase family 39 protein [Gammaproteobacteria bacterium]
MSTPVNNRQAIGWLLLVMLAAAGLRFYGLTVQSYWFDELFSAYYSDPAHSFQTVLELTFADVHPPLYQVLMWLSYNVFGYTEWAGRLVSAIAGTLAIPVIWLLGRELFNSRVGLYAAALAVVNYYLLYYSQEARSYALFYLLCSLSLLFFIRSLRYSEARHCVGFIISSLALAYTHYFGFILFVAEACILLSWLQIYGWSDRALIKRAVISAAVVLVGILPLLNIIIGHSGIENFWIYQPGPAFLVNYFILYFYSSLLAAAMFILILAGCSQLVVQRSWTAERFMVLALVIWIFLGYFLPWLRGELGQPVLTDRNTIMLLPAMLIIGAYGLSLLPMVYQRVLILVLVGYSLYFLIGPLGYYTKVKKNQYREITQALDQYSTVFPVYTLEYNETKYNVYFRQMGTDIRAVDFMELEALLEAGEAPAVFWLADGFGRLMQTDIDERFGLIEIDRLEFRGTRAVLYKNPAVSE